MWRANATASAQILSRNSLGQVRRRRQLDDLLVAPLHAAVPLVEMDHVAVRVGQDLHLDVARIDHRLLEVDRRIPERRLGFPAGRLDRFGQRGGIGDPAHPATAAAGDRLDEQRELASRPARRHQLVDRRRRRRRRQHRQPGFARRRDRAGLVSGQLKHFGAWGRRT